MSTLFFRKPRLLVLTLMLIVAAGLAAYTTLPRMEDPEITDRTASVVTRLPGATAERVEALVTERIEEELEEIREIKTVSSSSRPGVSIVAIELADEVIGDEAGPVWSRVRDELDDAAALLPADATAPDFDVQHTSAYTLLYAITWDREDAPNHALLRRHAEALEDVLAAVPGTRDTELFGDVSEEIRVEFEPATLASLGLSAQDVAARIAAADSKVAAGQMRGGAGELLLEVEGELDSLARIEHTPLVYGEHGRVVRVGDIATVHKGIAQPSTELALIDGQIGIAVGARMDGSRRVDQWTLTAENAVGDFAAGLPRGVALVEVFRQSGYTDARFGDLMSNLLLGALMVVGVIWLMMGWRSAIVVGVALPLTSLMVLAGMSVLDVPMHQFSITGLIIALGLLIDNAIVMVDEVNHRRSEGLSPLAAIRKSVAALAIPLLGSTFTTALAFLPLLLMPGGAGEFVGALSVSVILAIGSSLFLALTVLPALTVRLGGNAAQQPARWWRTGFRLPALANLHRASLDFLLRRPLLGVAFALLLPMIGFAQAGNLVEQFFPAAGRDQFSVELRMPVEAPLSRTEAMLRDARDTLLEHAEIERVHWFAGNSAPRVYYNQTGGEDDSAYFAQAIVQLRDGEGAAEVIRQTQAELNQRHPDGQFLVRQFEQGPPFAAPIELRIYGPDLDRLDELGQQTRRILSEIEGVEHTRSSLVHGRPKLVVRMDQEEANRGGLTNVDVARQLDADLEGAYGGSFLEATEELPVRVRVRDADRSDVASLASLELRAEAGGSQPRWIPLSAFAELDLQPELAVVPRRNGSRVNTVLGFTSAGTLPEVARAEFERRLGSGEFALPPGYRTEFGGETAERDTAVGNILAPVALLGVLMAGTLVLAFNSFRFASIIGVVAALSMGLSLGALWFWGYPFGFMAIVGTMGLLGVAINDAIVVLAALREDAAAATGDPAAVRDVVVRSTRHVLATTVTTIAGFTPLMLAGGEFWPPLAVAIAGGVAGATILALYFVPSAFVILSRRGARGATARTG